MAEEVVQKAQKPEIVKPGSFWQQPPRLAVDCSPEYVRMCVAATELQDWWRKLPYPVRYREGGKRWESHVRFGDYVHHGPHLILSHGGYWPQISMVAHIGVTMYEGQQGREEVTFRLEHDKGGFLYDQPAARFLDGYFVWLPSLGRLAEMPDIGPGAALARQAWAVGMLSMWESGENFFGPRSDATQEKVALNLLMSRRCEKLWDGERWEVMKRGTVI